MATVHVVGAGLAGLSAAVALVEAGRSVVLHEAAAQAGGRCRSYHDSKLGCSIDNGNHLMFSANHAALAYLETIGAEDSLMGPERARFPFVDLASGERWLVEPGAGTVPWWILSAKRRIPGTRISDYADLLKLSRAGPKATVAETLPVRGALWARFWQPLTVAALNTQPEEASAQLLYRVLQDSFLRGEAACRPRIARDGLAASLVEPALRYLERGGAKVRFNHRLRTFGLSSQAVQGLDFGEERIDLPDGDQVILAVPPAVAADLIAGLVVPQESRPIVNAHIRLPEAPVLPDKLPFLGLLGGTAEWLFVRGPIVSLTVSAAEVLVETPVETLAERLWGDTARALDLDPALDPPIRVIKERRATFAQTPAMLECRPEPQTQWDNLLLAGDWTATGYPATIESAVRSGKRAAALVLGAQDPI